MKTILAIIGFVMLTVAVIGYALAQYFGIGALKYLRLKCEKD